MTRPLSSITRTTSWPFDTLGSIGWYSETNEAVSRMSNVTAYVPAIFRIAWRSCSNAAEAGVVFVAERSEAPTIDESERRLAAINVATMRGRERLGVALEDGCRHDMTVIIATQRTNVGASFCRSESLVRVRQRDASARDARSPMLRSWPCG
jgi:hypothetical protein